MRAEAALTRGTGEDARALLDTAMAKSTRYVHSFSSGIGTVGDFSSDPLVSTGAGNLDKFDRSVKNYKANVLTAYDAASADGKLNIVIKEFRLALWGNGNEAWNAMRRTGKPNIDLQRAREADHGDFPRLFPYPSDYVNLNANATQQAMTTTVFWDTNGGSLR